MLKQTDSSQVTLQSFRKMGNYQSDSENEPEIERQQQREDSSTSEDEKELRELGPGSSTMTVGQSLAQRRSVYADKKGRRRRNETEEQRCVRYVQKVQKTF